MGDKGPEIRKIITKRAKHYILDSYSLIEEVWHSLTHGLGLALSIAGTSVLILRAVDKGDAWHVVSFSIYGASLILLYLASTLYHSITNTRAKIILRVFDHCAIYFLIAGSYTPFTLTVLRPSLGWPLFGCAWGGALLGFCLKFLGFRKYSKLSSSLYLILGWLCIIASYQLYNELSFVSFLFLVVGGLIYTLGFVFYIWHTLSYNHVIWHLFVLVASVLHYFSIWYLV